MQVRLAGETDFAGFRRAARGLLAQGTPPDEVAWHTADGDTDLFAHEPPSGEFPDGAAPASVPAFFVGLCEAVILHRNPQRFALLYRLLWRLVHEPQLRSDPLDADILLTRQWSRQVGHDIHKMRAFVRFRTVDDGGPEPLHVAWFEPAHRIVEANAPWFRRRFANMRWAILTPDACVHWDGQALRTEPGASREDAPGADAGEALWLTYYRSIFNPARLKLDMMRKEMPRRYWHNLPEASLIGELAQQATERSGAMIEQPATHTRRRVVPLAKAHETLPAPGSIAALHRQVSACRDCPGAAAATQAVNGEGAMQPALMLVGEQPGDQEDLLGRPFVGPAGQLLDRAMREAGIVREQAYLTNAVRHFHFELRGKRRIHKSPGVREIQACAHWLEHEIALVQPRALVALGATAARALLGRAVAVTRERGQWHVRSDGLPVFVTLHPSALLRLPPPELEAAFEELRRDLAQAFTGTAGTPPSPRSSPPPAHEAQVAPPALPSA